MLARFTKIVTTICLMATGAMHADAQDVTWPRHTHITQQEIKDLELLQGNNEQGRRVIDFLDYAVTTAGKEALQQLLCSPIADAQILQKRQAVIAYLHNHPVILQDLHNEIRLLGLHENSCTLKHSAFETKALDGLYFNWGFLQRYNSSSTALTIGQIADVVALAWPNIEHILAHYVMSDALSKALGFSCNHNHDHKDGHVCKHDHHPKGLTNTVLQFGYNTYNVAHSLVHVAGVYKFYQDISNKKELIEDLERQLGRVYVALQAIDTIYTTIANDAMLEALCAEVLEQDLHIGQEQIARLINTLNIEAFEQENSALLNCGTILATYHKLMDAQQDIAALLHLVGAIEVYTSLAQTIATAQQEHKTYCFVDYDAQSATPYVSLENAWHPLLSEPVSLLTLDIGVNDSAASLIVTGNNMAGKSTALKTVALNILLAQTCGFACAQSMKFTPFDALQTSLNLADDIVAGNSGFATELLRADSMISHIKEHASKGFVFLAVDELFVGSSADKGSDVLEHFVEFIGTQQHVVSICATHYVHLVQYAHDMPERYTHFCSSGTLHGSNKQYTFRRARKDQPLVVYSSDNYPALRNSDILLGE